jgi:hypothetical protein
MTLPKIFLIAQPNGECADFRIVSQCFYHATVHGVVLMIFFEGDPSQVHAVGVGFVTRESRDPGIL